ncbi:MAG TPA: PKD domain-containing protein [Rubrivivax sp.]|nr:PKD domain-containing protein [Rubrivivax sp.]
MSVSIHVAAGRFAILAVAAAMSLGSFAAPPVVKTVPWVASNPVIPHTSWSGKQITLKGTSDLAGGNIQYRWNPGDGSADKVGVVTNGRAVEATHTYTGANRIVTATLTVTNTSTNESASQQYYVELVAKTLQAEVNVAIDEGLWYLHKSMTPYLTDQGYWATSYNAETPSNLNAFFVNGHLETGADANPYTDTVRRGMKRLFSLLSVSNIPMSKTYPAPIGTVNPDSNANGIAIYANADGSYTYASGIYMTAIVASGTPDAITSTGPGNVIGRRYKDIVQDMVDGYAYGQTNAGVWMGGWGYDWLSGSSDNSVNQWATIGMMAAADWGGTVVVPAWVKTANITSLNNTQATTANCGAGYDGAFAYTNNYCYFPWGPYGTTPAGMVQMVNDGIGRGDARWDRTENFIRNNFCSASPSSTANLKRYYYGLFSFTKSMLLSPGGGLRFLTNRPPGVAGANPIDWYAAQSSQGDACDGVARTLVNDQNANGSWPLRNDYGYHTVFSSAWAIMMLNRTVYESGVPVAVAKVTPNPAVVGQTVTLDGSASFHQDSAKAILQWEWDLNNDGVYDRSGVVVTTSFAALGSYPVTLRVADNSSPAKVNTTTATVVVSIPPLAPTANAGGPYNFCPAQKPWFLDGTASVNPDQGQSQGPGFPGDLITSYLWDLDGSNAFATPGAQPDVTAYFGGKSAGSYLVQLKVTDNTALSFPASGMGNLSSVAGAQVRVLAATDPACACIADLAARPKAGKIQLTWAAKAGAAGYNVYRGTVSGGPYLKIATTASTYATYLDSNAVNGTRYYYVVRPTAANAHELCQSNQASAIASTR